MNYRTFTLLLLMTSGLIPQTPSMVNVSRTEILIMIGLNTPSTNPDQKPGLHAARVKVHPGPLRLDTSEFSAGFRGIVIYQLFINATGKVARIEPLYGPQNLKKRISSYAHRWEFSPEENLNSIYPIYLFIDVRFKEAKSYSANVTISSAP